MKVAVCMSGQPRFVEECFESINSNLILPNAADVFLHTWECDEEGEKHPYKFGGNGDWKNHRMKNGLHEKALELYKPIDCQIDKPMKLKVPGIDMKRTFDKYMPGCYEEAAQANMTVSQYSDRIVSNNLSMWYGIMQSNMLATINAMKNGFKYDVVVRCRFDLFLNTYMNFGHLDNNVVYACEMGKPDGHIADWLNFGSQSCMNVFASTFLAFTKIYEDIEKFQMNPFCNEQALAINLARHGISAVNVPIQVDLPRL